MDPRRRFQVLVVVVAVGVAAVGAAGAPGSRGASPSADFRAVSGESAASFSLPADVRLVKRLELTRYGLTYERYQQQFGPAKADVDGGQLTLYRDATGRVRLVLGAHYPSITPTNKVSVNAAEARQKVDSELGNGFERTVELMIDPASGRYFWQVDSRRFGSHWIHRVDAHGGNVILRRNALENDHGIGVKGDTKSMVGLTRPSGGQWELASPNDRQTTLDVQNGTFLLFQIFDADNHWLTPGTASPGQPAAVDAQYYAKTTDDYYLSRFGFDWWPCYPPTPFSGPGMRSAVHYGVDYNNAFFDGRYTGYGDGDGVIFRELSGGLDVVAHEHTHGVTNCTSQLSYAGESGALNEAFSDMIGSSAEWFANEPTVSPDWVIGEDVYLPVDTVPGFRNMLDPEEDGDPDHYSERYTGTDDNGGVHTNSGIPNHAYALLVNGGANASCAAPSTHSAAHCTDADTQDNGVVVTGIGVGDAEKLTFLAYTGLTSNASMCDARAAVEAAASSLFGPASQQRRSASDAYVAVGLTDSVCGGGPPPPPPPPNTAPTASPRTATTAANTPVTITLAGSDAETCELAFSVVGQPTKGSLGSIVAAACTSGSPNSDTATVTYTPNAGVSGSDSFTYAVNDGSLDSIAATVSITVTAQPTMHVGDLDRSSANNGKTWTATVTAQVDNESHGPVDGATVTGSWTGGASGSSTCTTGANGRCSVARSGIPKKAGSAAFTVTNVTHATRAYAPSANHDPDGDSTGTSVTVLKP
jgi:Zn-dependent metalloprotease